MTVPEKWTIRSIAGHLMTRIAATYGYAAIFGLLD